MCVSGLSPRSLAASGGGAHLPHRDVQMPWAQDALEWPCAQVALDRAVS
jgi:hypothetical protein